MCNRFFTLCAAATAGIALLLSGCGKPELVSQWRGGRVVVIDGDDGEWQNARHLLENENLVYGIFNDAKYLYLYFNLSDRTRQMQIARSGLTVWLDGGGGKGKTFGVRYPLAMTQDDMPEGRPGFSGGGSGGRSGGRFRGGVPSGDPAQLARLMEKLVARHDFEILGPLKDQRTRSSGLNTAGIEVAASWSNGRLVYELKVPLARGDDYVYAVGARADKPLGLGLEARMPYIGAGMEMGGRGGIGGMGGGMRRGRGGGMRRGPGGGRSGRPGGSFQPEPLELWAKLRLAASEESPAEQR